MSQSAAAASLNVGEGGQVRGERPISTAGRPGPGAKLRLTSWVHTALRGDTEATHEAAGAVVRLQPGGWHVSLKGAGQMRINVGLHGSSGHPPPVSGGVVAKATGDGAEDPGRSRRVIGLHGLWGVTSVGARGVAPLA